MAVGSQWRQDRISASKTSLNRLHGTVQKRYPKYILTHSNFQIQCTREKYFIRTFLTPRRRYRIAKINPNDPKLFQKRKGPVVRRTPKDFSSFDFMCQFLRKAEWIRNALSVELKIKLWPLELYTRYTFPILFIIFPYNLEMFLIYKKLDLKI